MQDLHLAGLYLGEIKYAAYYGKKIIGRALDARGESSCLRIQIAP